jgi:hypothetical protein
LPKNSIIDTLKKGFAEPKKLEKTCLHCIEIDCAIRETCEDNEKLEEAKQ